MGLSCQISVAGAFDAVDVVIAYWRSCEPGLFASGSSADTLLTVSFVASRFAALTTGAARNAAPALLVTVNAASKLAMKGSPLRSLVPLMVTVAL